MKSASDKLLLLRLCILTMCGLKCLINLPYELYISGTKRKYVKFAIQGSHEHGVGNSANERASFLSLQRKMVVNVGCQRNNCLCCAGYSLTSSKDKGV